MADDDAALWWRASLPAQPRNEGACPRELPYIDLARSAFPALTGPTRLAGEPICRLGRPAGAHSKNACTVTAESRRGFQMRLHE